MAAIASAKAHAAHQRIVTSSGGARARADGGGIHAPGGHGDPSGAPLPVCDLEYDLDHDLDGGPLGGGCGGGSADPLVGLLEHPPWLEELFVHIEEAELLHEEDQLCLFVTIDTNHFGSY